MTLPVLATVRENSPLAIVCGAGSLPFAVADAAARRGRRVILFGIKGWADQQRITAYRHHWARYGQFGWFCRVARAEGCRDVVFAGSLVRPSLRQLRPDFKTVRLLPRLIQIFRGGDDHLLSGVVSIFEEHGFHLIGAHEIAPEILMPEGTLGRYRPGSADQSDIKVGLALLKSISAFDIGQAAVVADGRILAVEAAEGTDHMLARVAQLRQSGRIPHPTGRGVLVKAAKQHQDRRVDLPSIGPQTIAGVARAGLAGIAVSAASALLVEPEDIIKAADGEKLFVVGVGDSGEPE